MPRVVKGFYAYPDEPPNIGETVNRAIKRLRESSRIREDSVRLKPWSANSVSGKPLVSTILKQIERNQIFACDLTYPVPNVCFELGYAIAKFKRVFVSLNPDIRGSTRVFNQVFFALLNIGYAEYDNHESLASAFLEEKPWKSLGATLLEKRYRQHRPLLEFPTLVYVKPPINTTSVISIQEEFKNSAFGRSTVVDDPKEYKSPTIEWYAEKLLIADAVVIHLLSTDHDDHSSHNLKASIIAGLARGFGRETIMLAHAPFRPPIDYQRWLSVHDTATDCVATIESWLHKVGSGLKQHRPRSARVHRSTSSPIDIRSLTLGDPVAENEARDLPEYFLPTASYNRAIRGPLTILIGRRGSGKTAILYAISSKLGNNKNKHVTILKPVGYETHGLIRVLESAKQWSERGYLIESLWKFLIYSEIAKNLKTKLADRPIHQTLSSEESAFLEYCEANSAVLGPPFSERLENAVSLVEGIEGIVDAREQRLRISENLHDRLIGDLRHHLGAALAKKNEIVVLIDGLDEPWRPGEHVAHLAELIGGLLGVSRSILEDFRRSSNRVEPIEAKIAILLRSDIFSYVQQLVPEQDKLPIERVSWSDREMLLRVLEMRVLYGATNGTSAEEVWQELFTELVDGVSWSEFLLNTVLLRPRDLIHMVNTAISIAINRGHTKIMPEDLKTARVQYSQYAFDSILNEDDPEKGMLESVLYEFAGSKVQLTRDEIESRMVLAGVGPEDLEFYLNLLCDLNFLGIKSKDGYRYATHEIERDILRNNARVLSSNAGRGEVFEINPAFHEVLEVD